MARFLFALTLCFASESAAQCVNAKRATPSTPVAVAEASALVRFGQHLAGTRTEMRARHGAPLDERTETSSWFGAAAIDTASVARFLGPAPLTRSQGDTTESGHRLAPDGDADEGLSLRFVRGKLVTAIWDFYTG